MARIKSFIIVLLFSFSILAWAGDRYPFTDTKQRDHFDQMMQEFRCLVCQNEDLASSNAELADDLRQQIYEMVKSGKSDAEIKRYMVNRYGDFVLFKPSFNRQTFILWVAPFFLLILGFFWLFWFFCRGRSR